MVAAGRAYEDRLLGRGTADNLPARRNDIIKVRNETGANRKRGEVLMIGDKIITKLTDEHQWCEGKTPKDNVNRQRIGVLRYDVTGGSGKEGITQLQINGACIALVNIEDVNHRRAYVKKDECVLTSSNAGPIELLWSPEETGDEQECLVRIGRFRSIPIFKAPSNGVPKRSGTTCGKANCTPYMIDEEGELVEIKDASNLSFTVEVFHMFKGADIPGGSFFQAKEDGGILVADAADC